MSSSYEPPVENDAASSQSAAGTGSTFAQFRPPAVRRSAWSTEADRQVDRRVNLWTSAIALAAAGTWLAATRHHGSSDPDDTSDKGGTRGNHRRRCPLTRYPRAGG
jgi:hypothetical protein